MKHRGKEYWNRLMAEHDSFHARMDTYKALPVEERLDKFREEIRHYESAILEITGDTYPNGVPYGSLDSEEKMETVNTYLGCRYFALSKMFEIHCGEAEVARLEALNDRLLTLTQDMFSRTSKMYRYILDMPLDEKDDDIEVQGSLRYWDDGLHTILELEDDAFYGSDFKRMIPVIAEIDREHKGDLEIIHCSPCWYKDSGHTSSMTDKELGIENILDDGTTWAEAWLRLPKLDHICMCYAIHALVTHKDYSIPDLLRLNGFEVKVEVKVQQITEQDGSRWNWTDGCEEEQFIDKFLHEAGHRPVEAGLGEFVRRRGLEYFELTAEPERTAGLPDCTADDSLAIPFLKALYRLVNRKK